MKRRRPSSAEGGFTLAGLIVILTIMAVFIAYTVPRQWSKIMQREREKQTIFAMKQYVRAIDAYSKMHGLPVSMDQLKEARTPRVIRGVKGEFIDPLTGKVDWILVPPGAVTGAAIPTNPGNVGGIGVYTPPPSGGASSGGSSSGTPSGGSTGANTGGAAVTSGTGASINVAASPKDYTGPFVGVRPPITGKSIITFKGAESYDQWFYSTADLNLERASNTGAPVVGGSGPQ